jgi:catechol 2,3-dioxygenase-like lactoylglutathione lyase family enzyme
MITDFVDPRPYAPDTGPQVAAMIARLQGLPPYARALRGAVIDHIEIAVADVARAKAFYDAALAAVGIAVVLSLNDGTPRAAYGYGVAGQPHFFIVQGPPFTGMLHVAFAAKDRATVDAFHGAAIAAGGRDNGSPGPRPQYHPNYYGAFVLDPDGHNVEAVCHAAP